MIIQGYAQNKKGQNILQMQGVPHTQTVLKRGAPKNRTKNVTASRKINQ